MEVENHKETGPEFNSKEEAFSYYKEYARSVGFSAIIKASRRSRISGNFIDAKFACTRYGISAQSPPSNPPKRKRGRTNLSWAKTDCKACMHVKRRHDGTWFISSFIKDHNHDTFPFPHHINNNNNTSLDPSNNNAEATTKSMFRKSKKRQNSKKVQHLAFAEGDLRYLLDCFMCMQNENPNFFYAVDFDEEQRLKSVFWVDAKARLDYKHFRDVVLLDTTHVKNECRLPFVPFVGVNHHFQFLLLGLALVSDESESTFAWLMRMWLKAMGGCAPKVMLTDQDEALKEAVAQVFPDSCHCFCLWHVFRMVPEKLGYVMHRCEDFMGNFNRCIMKSRTKEQFEKRWRKMVERFDLGDDSWLHSIYEDRERWIPAYMKDRVLVGMSSMQRPESMNCLLDRHMQRKTTMKEFLEQCRVVLQDKCEEEARADFEMMHKELALKSPSPFGKQMVELYTHAVFKKFQSEVLGVVACHPRKESEDGPTKVFRVQDFEDNQEFVVMWNESTLEASCSCHLFEFNGFLCRHVMIVLQMSGVRNIPPQYILKRWTKDAKNRHTARDLSIVVGSNSRAERYNNLCRQLFELSDEGSSSQQSYVAAVNALEEVLRKCESLKDTIQSVIEPSPPILGSQEGNLCNSANCTNKENSTLKKRQVRPEPEIIAIGVNSSWQQVENPNTRATDPHFSYESQQSIQEMDQLNSRAQNLDGYFSTQQVNSGMCQLNSLATIRNDYYSNQHGIRGLGQLNTNAPIHDARYMAPERLHGMAQVHFRQEVIPSCLDVQDSSPNVGQSNGGSTQLHGIGVNIKPLNSRHQSR